MYENSRPLNGYMSSFFNSVGTVPEPHQGPDRGENVGKQWLAKNLCYS